MSELFDPPLVPGRFLRVAVERAVDWYPGGLLYSVPATCEDVHIGHRVLVPLGRGNAEVPGTVVDRLGSEALAEDGVT
ncbi:MAG: primosomal protein N' family DNA-binding protein, partial [Planctomycetota bacterium]